MRPAPIVGVWKSNTDPPMTSDSETEGLRLKAGQMGAGEVARIDYVSKFGFIKVDGGEELFFRLRHGADALRPGSRVTFVVGTNRIGLTAENVHSGDTSHLLQGGVSTGEIDLIEDGFMYGFIRADDGRRFFFHRSELKEPQHMSWLTAGTPVRFRIGSSEKGPIGLSVEQQYNSFLVGAFASGDRIIAKMAMRKPGSTYGFAHTPGGTVLIRSEDFRNSADWQLTDVGESVSFKVEINHNQQFVGRDIYLDAATGGA
jgi:cold shock CspA family protein